MQNTLIFDADNDITLCLEIVKTDENALVIEVKANNFTAPKLDIRNNGGTASAFDLVDKGDFLSYEMPISRWICHDISSVEIRVRCTSSGACSEWVKINTPIIDTTKNVLLNQISDREFTTATGSESGGGGSYVLPIASATTLGGIKVGDGLSIDENGVLSATGGSARSMYTGVSVIGVATTFDECIFGGVQ